MSSNSVIERFEELYIPEPNSGCWIWLGATERNRMGYGSFWMNGRNMAAHRASHLLYIGEIPPSLWVLHKCDNPGCVNPVHLFVGSSQDNVADMVSKGRQNRGVKHPNAKLNSEAATFIRGSSLPQVDLAEMYGVTPKAIRQVLNWETWK